MASRLRTHTTDISTKERIKIQILRLYNVQQGPCSLGKCRGNPEMLPKAFPPPSSPSSKSIISNPFCLFRSDANLASFSGILAGRSISPDAARGGGLKVIYLCSLPLVSPLFPPLNLDLAGRSRKGCARKHLGGGSAETDEQSEGIKNILGRTNCTVQSRGKEMLHIVNWGRHLHVDEKCRNRNWMSHIGVRTMLDAVRVHALGY